MRKDKKLEFLRADLKEQINQVETALLNLHNNMQLVNDDGLLDYYAYRIKSEESKHNYLIKQIKRLEIES